MSLSKSTGVISCPAATGNFSVTGLGFEPQLVMFFQDGTTAAGGATTYSNSMGAMDDSGNQFACSNYSQNAQGTANTKRRFSTSQCAAYIGSAGVLLAANYVSTDFGGFTINFSTVNSGRRIYYVALGGFTEVKVGNFSLATSIGTKAVTGVGFEPEALILASSFGVASGTTYDDNIFSMGFASGTANRYTNGIWSDDNVDTSNTSKVASTSNILIALSGHLSTDILVQADLDSFDSGGFTLDITTAPSSAYLCGYIAIDGVDAYVGDETISTTATTKATTGVGFQPEVNLFASVMTSLDDTVSALCRQTIGVAISSSAQFCIASEDLDNQDTSSNYRYNNTGAVLTRYNSAIVEQANLDSFDTDGFTLDTTTASGSARIFGFLSLKQSTQLPIKFTFNTDEISKGIGPATAAQLGGVLVGG